MKIETKLDDLIITVNEIRDEIKCFATQNELDKVKVDVEHLKGWIWKGLGALAVILYIVQEFGDKIFN
jgi:hypothetical protein